MNPKELSGVWRSTYRFVSDSRKGEFEAEHYLTLLQKGHTLILESIAGANHSYALMRLTLDRMDDEIATGSWQEQTDATGYYKGAVYHGAIQLVVSPDRQRMQGKWVGFGRDMNVNTGPWQLEYIGPELPAGTHAKVVKKITVKKPKK